MSEKKQQIDEFIPRFQWRFLRPRYWGVWLGVGLLVALALIPVRVRDPLLAQVGRLAARLGKSASRRAKINLHYCLPALSAVQREAIVEQMFITATQVFVLMAELALRPVRLIRQRVRWHGAQMLEQLREQREAVILLVPHGWAVDIPAMLLAQSGQQVAAMFHHQSNPLVDYLWNKVRLRFGGRLHARKNGIKPFIQSVRQGHWGYYLPDEDHGAEHSYFVDFFATYKATLPVIGRLMNVCRAPVIPLFPVYDSKSHQLHIYVRPPMDDLPGLDEVAIARRMNEEIECLVGPHPEQYAWLLKLLRTRRAGDVEPYQRQDLYPD